MREIEKVVELIKSSGFGSVKYIKYSHVPPSSFYIKIFLLKPIDMKILLDVARELDKYYTMKIYAPHAHAIRIDLKKK